MKILLYTYDILKIGGIETSFYNLARHLTSMGHSVGVRYSVVSDMQRDRYKKAGIDIRFEGKEICDVLIVGSIWKRPRNIMAKLTVQQVHADWSDTFWNGAPSAVAMVKKASPEVDLFAAVSESSANFVRKITDKPVTVMYNLAPEAREIKKVKHDGVNIAAFTRMTTEKGKANYEALRDKMQELGIKHDLRVYNTGDAPSGWNEFEPVPDITTEFADIDYVASLADTESFGYTIAEANSCGVPCIIKKANSTLEFHDATFNIILDDIKKLTADMLQRRRKLTYTLREKTERSVNEAANLFDTMAKDRVTLKATRGFRDMTAKKQRRTGEIFTVPKDRANVLLKNSIKIVTTI